MSGPRGTHAPRLGVVIPTLEEEEALPHLLEDLRALPIPVEVVIADGGSSDGTREIARRQCLRVVQSPRGRGRQMNAGARALRTPWILFLHADSRLPEETRRAIAQWVTAPDSGGAATFRFRLEPGSWWRGPIEWGQRLRERASGLSYGDQGLLLSRERYEEIGGIPEIPVLEDVEAMRRLLEGGTVTRLEAPVVTSARRYREEGPIRVPLRNTLLFLAYTLGVSPERLAGWYRPRGRTGPPPNASGASDPGARAPGAPDPGAQDLR